MSDIYVKEANSPYIFSFPHSGEKLIREMQWQLIIPKAQKFLPSEGFETVKNKVFIGG